MHTLRYVSNSVWDRTTIHQADKFRDAFSIRYEHATVRWYTLSYDKVVQNFVLFYTFDISKIYATCTGKYAYVNVRYMYNSAYVRRSLCISFS